MRWEELEDALEELQSEREYDVYFCSIKDAEKLEAEEEEQNKKKKKSLTIAIDGKEIRSTGKMNYYLRAHT